ncbi:MAG: response regulator, partial [Oscillospiraceae bacterium]
MIKLLVADDEAIIRKGIHHYIDWKKEGIEVVGEAANGQEAFAKAMEFHPDIILTDIRMPGMSGMELAEKIQKDLPACKIIFLSGYSDREYLLSAIKFGVSDYVLKNSNPEEILKAVVAVKQKIEEELAQKTPVSEEKDLTGNDYLFLQNQIMRELLEGPRNLQNFTQRALHLNLILNGPCFMLIFFTGIQNTGPCLAALSLLLPRKAAPALAQTEATTLCALLNIDTEASRDFLLPLLEALKATAAGPFQAIVIDNIPSVSLISERWQAAKKNLGRCYWFPPYIAISDEQLNEGAALASDMLVLLEHELLLEFYRRDAAMLMEKLDQFQKIAQMYRLPIEVLRTSAKRIVAAGYSTLNDYSKVPTLLSQIENSSSPGQILDVVSKTAGALLGATAYSPIIENTIAYIHENYAKPLALEELAALNYITPSYLSRRFKEETHIGLLRYIHEVRIQHAKRLL